MSVKLVAMLSFSYIQHFHKLKMTQINFVSRNQYYKQLSTFEFWLEVAWLGAKCKGKTLLVIEIFFDLHRDCTVTA